MKMLVFLCTDLMPFHVHLATTQGFMLITHMNDAHSNSIAFFFKFADF